MKRSGRRWAQAWRTVQGHARLCDLVRNRYEKLRTRGSLNDVFRETPIEVHRFSIGLEGLALLVERGEIRVVGLSDHLIPETSHRTEIRELGPTAFTGELVELPRDLPVLFEVPLLDLSDRAEAVHGDAPFEEMTGSDPTTPSSPVKRSTVKASFQVRLDSTRRLVSSATFPCLGVRAVMPRGRPHGPGQPQ